MNDLATLEAWLLSPLDLLVAQLSNAATKEMPYQKRISFNPGGLARQIEKAVLFALELGKDENDEIKLLPGMILPVVQFVNLYGCQLVSVDKQEQGNGTSGTEWQAYSIVRK